MYLEHFGLQQQPFQLTPDSNFLYLSQGHKRAKAYMDYTVWNRDGFVVITGEIGSGKTTLIQSLLSSVGDDVVIARVYQTQLDEVEFFQAILVEFGFKPFSSNKVELIEMLNSYLMEQYEKGRQVILIIDEAQNLSRRVLEEVRMLTGMETQQERILNLVLVGQPELKQVLDAPGMEQLCQRIRFRFHLAPLNEDDIAAYVKHRLGKAGYDYTPEEEGRAEPIVHPECYPIIHRYTGGVPRLINALFDTALITAFVEQEKCISIRTLELSVDELQWIPYVERVGIKHFAEKNVASLNMAGEPTPKLVQMDGNKVVACFDITKEVTTIGRIPSNDIHVEIKSMSMHHAKVISFHNNFFLEDLRSTNGTLVNGHRINKCVLKAGDKISFARVDMEYRVDNINYQEKNVRALPADTKGINAAESVPEIPKNVFGGNSKAMPVQ
jgi:type II secretory pathway predicted ATPase ExeA/pSer/pThr/pTyr-binding forkhead associated (FHA) protein